MNMLFEISQAESLVPAIVEVEKHPEHLLIDEKLRARFLTELRSEVASAVPDLSTAKGRDEIRSRAAKINRSKSPINKAAVALKNGVDTARKAIVAELETLEIEARKPLTEWEEEKSIWTDFATIREGWTSDLVLGRMEAAKEMAAHPTLFADKGKAISALSSAYIRIKEAEEEKEELERLREAERARIDEERRRKDEENREAVELAAELDARREMRPAAAPSTVARQTTHEEKVAEPKPSIASPADAAFVALLTEIREDVERAAANAGVAIPVQAARAIVRAMVAGKVRHIQLSQA